MLILIVDPRKDLNCWNVGCHCMGYEDQFDVPLKVLVALYLSPGRMEVNEATIQNKDSKL